jgi:WD40 repeat protein/uncharacterized caspase-like protein
MCPVGVRTSRSTQVLETSQAKLWLLLVGVNQYQDERLPALRYSALDCQGLGEALAGATREFAHKQARIHHDFSPQLPHLSSVRANLKQIAAAAQPQDTILFYFSGHGILDLSSQQAVLCLADTDTDHLLDTGLPLQDVLQLLGNSCAHQQLVWLDACHSGGLSLVGARTPTAGEPVFNPTSQLVEVLQQRAQKSKGFYALLSCDQGQQSWEFPELGHGVFTYYLMRGLHGEAADSQGVIEADGLYRYVYHQTLQYIDKTNQQLRLINQQRLGRGETLLYPEYPLQTPKRIVEGVGELILGRRPDKGVESKHPRVALVVEGLSGSQTTLALSKMLNSAGRFELEYWPRPGKAASSNVREAITHSVAPEAITCSVAPKAIALRLEPQNLPQAEPATVLLYLRGRIEETEAGEPELVLGEDIRLSRSWLRQQLRRSSIAQQIVILDCPVGTKRQSPPLLDWVEDLQLGLERGQCIIAAASPATEPERFTQALLDTLIAGNQPTGLSVAGWITQLQVYLAGSGIQLHVWLSGAQGVIEVLPGRNGSRGVELTEEFDLGLCPYMGLSAFKEQDAQYFYGRESLTQQLINQLLHRSFLAVVGASGSGKSSVVQAGLIAQLRQGKQLPSSEQWWVKSFRPGAHPLEALVQRLVDTRTEKEKAKQQLQIEGMLHQGIEGFVYWVRSRPEPIVVLVVDQFEELFTLAPTEDRERFLNLVLGAVEYAQDRFKLVITLRSDFIASCLELPALAKALQQSSVLVPPRLSEDDYRRVIVKPAEQVGLKVEPELVEVLLQELSQSVGDLPVLEFVLEQLWEQRSHGELTLQAYQQQLGGVKGALQRSCQAVYEALDPQAQDCAKWIFLSLTQLGEGTEDTRRRVLKSELIVKKYPTALVERTLQALTAAKLVVMNLEEDGSAVGTSREAPSTPVESEELMLEAMKQEVTVEVAHEVLIRHWSTLRWWLEENRARLRSHRQIRQAAMLWKQSGEQSDFLLQGVRLAEAEEIYIKYTDELSEDVQRFIEACLEERQRQQLQEKRRLRQAQKAIAVISVLGVAALSFGGLAYWQQHKAQIREIEALNSLSKASLVSNQQLEALIASVKAGQHLKNTIKAPATLQSSTVNALGQVVYGTQERNRLEGHSSWVSSVSFNPDGKTLASGSADHTIKLWRSDGTLLKTLQGHSRSVLSVNFSPDGKLIASTSADKTIKLWSLDGTLLKTLQGHSDDVNTIKFSPDGKTIASVSADKTIKLWRLDGTLYKTLQPGNSRFTSVSFSPDGKTITSVNQDATIKLWSLDGALLKTFPGHHRDPNSINVSLDGQIIISLSQDGTAKLWSRNGALLTTLQGHSSWVSGISFSPDGKTIASASQDGTAKLWSRDGALLDTLKGHTGRLNSVSFSPDGKTIASASDDNTIKLWRRDEILPKTFHGHSYEVTSVSFSPDGQIIASTSQDRTVKLWSRDGVLLGTLKGFRDEVNSVSFNPDGKMIASASADKTIKLWSRDRTLLKTIKGHSEDVNSISFSPDGQMLASASDDHTIKLWRRDGTLLKTLSGHSSWVTSISFSPDGQTIASVSADNSIKLWRHDGTLLKTLSGHSHGVWSISFSPDSKTIASASQDGTIKLWSQDGHLLNTLKGHSDEVNSAKFSPDGQMIASGSDDHTIKLWSLDGRLLKTLQGHSGNVRSVSFSPDGKTLASASADKTVNLWSLDGIKLQTVDLDALLMRGCNELHDYLKTNPKLTREERQLCSGFSD